MSCLKKNSLSRFDYAMDTILFIEKKIIIEFHLISVFQFEILNTKENNFPGLPIQCLLHLPSASSLDELSGDYWEAYT